MKIKAALLACAVGWSGCAAAQNVSLPFVADTTRRIDVSVSASDVYDSNASRLNEDRARELDLDTEDFRFTPAAAVDIYVPVSGSNVLSVSGDASYNFYRRNKRLNGESLNLNAALASQIAFCDSTVEAGIGRRRSNPGDLGLIANQPEDVIVVNNFETTVSASATLACGPQIGFRPVGQISLVEGTNTNDLRRGSNYRTLTYGGGLLYMQPSIGEVALLVGQAESDYTARQEDPIRYPGITEFRARSIGASFTRAVTPQFQGRVQVNYTDVDSSGVDAFNGITGEASVRISPGGRAAFSTRVARQAVPALNFDVDYVVETLVQNQITYVLTPRLSLLGGYTVRWRDYVSSRDNRIRPLTDDTQQVVDARLRFQQSQRISFDLSAAYDTRKANDAFYDYDSVRVEFAVRLTR